MLELVIIRGLPGSGKTTMAKEQFPDHLLCEADQFFTDEEGNFKFDNARIREAHEFCHNKANDALNIGKSVVVANQFRRLKEMQAYVTLADLYGASLKVYECTGFYGSKVMDPDYLQFAKSTWEPIVDEPTVVE